LSNAYTEDELGGEKRTYSNGPVSRALCRRGFSLLRNKPALIEKAQEIYKMIKKDIPAVSLTTTAISASAIVVG